MHLRTEHWYLLVLVCGILVTLALVSVEPSYLALLELQLLLLAGSVGTYLALEHERDSRSAASSRRSA